jgi:Tfp pilus assembly protein PilF
MTSLNLNLFRVCLIAIGFGGASLASAHQDLPHTITPPHGTPGGSITGRVVLPSGNPVNDRVRITLSTPEDPGFQGYTDNNGYFAFANLPEGIYTVEVLADRKLYEPVSEMVRLIRSSRANLMIYLKEKSKPPNSSGNVVSATETAQQVPVPARKEYERATRLLNEGKTQEGIERLKQALAIYPDYLAARNDLGVQYLKLNRFAEATEQFEVAIEINPRAYNPRLNLGIVLLKLKKYNDATEHLNRAVAIDSSKPASHLYLGIALVETDELAPAERELATAVSMGGQEYAVAHFHLARVSMKKGERDEAIRELKSFLETSPTGEEAVRARLLLEKLRQGE